MSSKDSHILNFLRRNSILSNSQNINHFQFIRKHKSAKKKQETLFSNNILKNTILSIPSSEDVLIKNIQNSYTCKKSVILFRKPETKGQSINPYKKAIAERKNIENQILKSLQQSLQINKQTIIINRSHSALKSFRHENRSKTSLQLTVPQSEFHQKAKNYQKLAIINPEQKRSIRVIKSALINRQKSQKTKNIPLSEFLKGRNLSQSKLIN